MGVGRSEVKERDTEVGLSMDPSGAGVVMVHQRRSPGGSKPFASKTLCHLENLASSPLPCTSICKMKGLDVILCVMM